MSATRSRLPGYWLCLGVLFFIKGILLIPHIIIIYFLNIASFAALYISYWAVLITGKYPRGLFNFQAQCAALVAPDHRLVRWLVGPLPTVQHELGRLRAGRFRGSEGQRVPEPLLLPPVVSAHVVPPGLPEARPVLAQQIHAVHPLGALPAEALRDD